MEPVPTVNVRLWLADAIVLFDWLNNTDLNLVPTTHPGVRRGMAEPARARRSPNSRNPCAGQGVAATATPAR